MPRLRKQTLSPPARTRRSRSRSRVAEPKLAVVNVLHGDSAVGPLYTPRENASLWDKVLQSRPISMLSSPIAPLCPQPQVYYAPTGEMLFFHRILGWLFSPDRPNLLSRILQFFFVAPYTNVTNFSLFYQMYLNKLVHRRFLTQFFHHLCTPFIITFIWACCAQFHYFSVTPFGLFTVPINGAFIWYMTFNVWYLIWGFITVPEERVPLLGPIALVPNTLMLMLANIWQNSFGVADHAMRPCSYPLLCPTSSIWTSPWLIMLILIMIQSWSHAAEMVLPPRTTQYDWWIPFGEYVLPARRYTFRNAVRLVFMLTVGLAGALDELLVTPRLHPIHFLEYVSYFTGYKKDLLENLDRLYVRSCDPATGNNPALDFIGIGGGAYLWQARQMDGGFIDPPSLNFQGRRQDAFFALAFFAALVYSWFWEFIPAFAPANMTDMQQWYTFGANAMWPPQFFWHAWYWYIENVSPLALQNPVFLKISSMAGPVIYTVFYPFAIYAFVEGKNWIRIPVLLWAGMECFHSLLIVLVEVFEAETLLTRSMPMLLVRYGLSLTLPYLATARLLRDRPFPTSVH